MAKGIKIIGVEPDSLAAELEFEIGDRVWTINGRRVRDALDFKFLTSGEEELTLEVIKAGGEEWRIEIEKDESESWGIDFEAMTPRQCGNDCVFCFIQQNPEGSRQSLWVRDEDIRFSFMYGNYSTLTTITNSETERVIEQRLSPQYVSVHTTDPELRAYMLGIDKKIDVIAQLKYFIERGIEIHAQIVLCPTINDGERLNETIYDLAELHPGVVSTAIVPLGVTDKHKYRDRLTPVTDDFCREIIDQVEPIQRRLKRKLGTVFAFLGDEFYIRAGRGVPAKSHYRIVRGHATEDDEYPQIEDGVGMTRQFFDAHAKRMKQLEKMRLRGQFDQSQASRIYGALATGLIFYPMLKEAVEEMNRVFGTRLHAVPVENIFFGEGVTVAGLLSGVDFLNARDKFRGEFLMIPPHSFRAYDRRFLDGMTVGELASELVLPIKSDWNDLLSPLGTPDSDERPQVHRTVLSHDYGSVTSISV
jgi:putative radical SAM enzyme (TIGR03279 family)